MILFHHSCFAVRNFAPTVRIRIQRKIIPIYHCVASDNNIKMGKEQSKGQCRVKDADDEFVTVKSYQGETKNGKRHGRGVYLYPNGDMYDGEWRKSRKYGRGVYMYANGQRCAFPHPML